MTRSSASSGSSDTIEERVPANRLKLWLLLSANRWLVTGVLLAGLFVVFVVLGTLDPASLRSAVSNKDPIETLFQALVTAIITGVTLVVTINQLVLSQELGAVGDQRERMRGAMQFRRDVEAVLDRPVSPPDPASFLQAIVERAAAHGDRLLDSIEGNTDDRTREDLQIFVDELRKDAYTLGNELEDAQFGTFAVVNAAIDFDYSVKIYRARRLRSEHANALNDGARAALDDIVETLELFAPAREHFKTLYFQWELINLSRAVLYAAVPALVVTSAMILFVDNVASITGATLAVDNLVWTVAGATVVALLPFVLLLSYMLRITTVAKRTLAIGPFVLRTTGSNEIDEWE